MDRPDEVVIRVPGSDQARLNARAVFRALSSALDALEHVYKEAGRVTWVIDRITKQSPLEATLAPSSEVVSDAGLMKINRLFEGIKQFERGDRIPAGWDVETARAVTRLAKHASNGLGSILLRSPKYGQVQPGIEILANLHAAVRRETTVRKEWTTLEGSLDDVLAHGVLQFRIYDPITGDPIRCLFADDEDIEKVKASLKRRVVLYGLTKMAKGRPTEIRVTKFRPIPTDLPKSGDLRPMDLTGGADSVEFVRRGRDEEDE